MTRATGDVPGSGPGGGAAVRVSPAEPPLRSDGTVRTPPGRQGVADRICVDAGSAEGRAIA